MNEKFQSPQNIEATPEKGVPISPAEEHHKLLLFCFLNPFSAPETIF